MLKLSLRELLMLLTIVGIALGWQMDRLHQRKAAKSQLRLQQVTEQQFESLVALLHGEGFVLERDSGGWPVRFVQAPIIRPQPLNRRGSGSMDCGVKLEAQSQTLSR